MVRVCNTLRLLNTCLRIWISTRSQRPFLDNVSDVKAFASDLNFSIHESRVFIIRIRRNVVSRAIINDIKYYPLDESDNSDIFE